MWLSCLLACSEYDVKSDADSYGPDTAAPDRPTDEDPPANDTGPEGGDSGGGGDDTGPDDDCWEPEDGYEENPAARIFTTDSTTPVIVTFLGSSSGYDNELWLDSPESLRLAQAWTDPVGTWTSLGPYATGTELVLAIYVTDTGERFLSGPASRNSDGVEHVSVTYEGDCSWRIGFEDLTGGGDLDFNDVELRIEGMLKQEI